MAFQDGDLPTALRIPDPGGLVARRRDNALTIATEARAEQEVCMAFEHDQLATSLHIPDPGNGALECQHPLAVRAEDRRKQGALRSPEQKVEPRRIRRPRELRLKLGRERRQPWNISRRR